jgi:hypothetical protein
VQQRGLGHLQTFIVNRKDPTAETHIPLQAFVYSSITQSHKRGGASGALAPGAVDGGEQNFKVGPMWNISAGRCADILVYRDNVFFLSSR